MPLFSRNLIDKDPSFIALAGMFVRTKPSVFYKVADIACISANDIFREVLNTGLCFRVVFVESYRSYLLKCRTIFGGLNNDFLRFEYPYFGINQIT